MHKIKKSIFSNVDKLGNLSIWFIIFFLIFLCWYMYRNAIIEDINIKVCDMKFDITWCIKILLLNTVDSKLPTKIIGTDKRKHAGDTKSVYKFLIYLLNTIMLKIPTIHDETNKFDSSVFDSIKILPFKIRNVCPSNAEISKILDIFE